jgi:hypothetical protein
VGSKYLRIRFTEGSTSPAFTGTSSLRGEVEDYAVSVVAPCPTVSLSPTTLAGGTVGTAYSQTVTASGGTAPYTYSITSGSLPSGLSLNTSTGAITGTPLSADSGMVTGNIDINGGYSWGGWSSRGLSNQLGVYSGGPTNRIYELYTTRFAFNSAVHTVDSRAIQTTDPSVPKGFAKGTFFVNGATGYTNYNRGSTTLNNTTSRPVTTGGAFDNGNTIVGIGVRVTNNT